MIILITVANEINDTVDIIDTGFFTLHFLMNRSSILESFLPPPPLEIVNDSIEKGCRNTVSVINFAPPSHLMEPNSAISNLICDETD